MLSKASLIGLAGLAISLGTLAGAPAFAGEILISQDTALAGGITVGDEPGFPITISAPGRYRIVGNLDASPGSDGVVIDSDDVTLDFDGFTLRGAGEGATGIISSHDSIEIRDGVITGFPLFAIDSHSVGRFWTVSGMRIVGNGLGVSAGTYARVVDNNISDNNNYGLSCQFCLIEGNVVALNHDDGIDVKGATLLGNMIASNRGYGISAFMLGYVLSGYGNNTLVNNNGAGGLGTDGQFIPQRPQVNGRLLALQPNVE
jgi:Periplasmic copper-binding protein (NosD)